MQELITSPVLKVYRSSAGSGKTFTLVKEYLSIVFKSTNPFAFKEILAITFTNKAANEMKDRILEVLQALSKKQKSKDDLELLEIYHKQTNIDKLILESKSARILSKILHNYSEFSVFTIDKFTHRLIRSFSRELGLSLNFNVELNEKEFLEFSVQQFLSNIGDDKILTSYLNEFIDQTLKSSVKSNVVNQLSAFQRILFKGNRDDQLKAIEHLPLEEFSLIRNKLFSELNELESSNEKAAKLCIEKANENGIVDDYFHYKNSRFPRLFELVANRDSYTMKNIQTWQGWLDQGKWIGTVTDKSIIQKFEQIIPFLEKHTIDIINFSKRIVYLKEILKYFTSYSLLNQLVNEIEKQKKLQGVLLISDFNRLITKIIVQEPAAFIFERIGNRYKHFLFDEFQDTSIRQWNNLVPLVHESLSTGGINLLVGDAKQAIYRWREGDVSQFINLPLVDHSLPNSREINSLFKQYYQPNELSINRRSFTEIIQFNNQLFSTVVKEINQDLISKAYQNNKQDYHRPSNGYVEVCVCNKEERLLENRLAYILKIINQSLADGYSYGDIAVVVRKNSQATKVAEFLSVQKNPSVPVLSGDSIVLSSSAEVKFIISVLRAVDFDDNHAKLNVLNFLNRKKPIDDISSFLINDNQYYNSVDFNQLMKVYTISFDYEKYLNFGLIDKIHFIVSVFQLNKHDPFITQFLSIAFDFINANGGNVLTFLDYFDNECNRISVDIGNEDAVNIISIHKSKGLQFPVVIIPFGSWLDKEGIMEDFDWIHGDDLIKIGLTSFVAPLSETALENLNRVELFSKEKAQLLLDNVNLYYVAFTRAKDRLYVSIDESIKGTKTHVKHYISSAVVQHQMYDEVLKKLIFGSQKLIKSTRKVIPFLVDSPVLTKSLADEAYLSLDKNRSSYTLNKQNFFGTILHKVMEKVKCDFSIAFSYIEELKRDKVINSLDEEKLLNSLSSIQSSNELLPLFSNSYSIYNEIELITPSGDSFRIDRLNIDQNNSCIVIDYKTGSPTDKDVNQIRNYITQLKDADYNVSQGILIYLPKLIIKKVEG